MLEQCPHIVLTDGGELSMPASTYFYAGESPGEWCAGIFDNYEEGLVLGTVNGITIKGENFESSGLLDPSFWPIHPTTDRMFQAAIIWFQTKQGLRCPVPPEVSAEDLERENPEVSSRSAFMVTTYCNRNSEVILSLPM